MMSVGCIDFPLHFLY